MELGAILKSPNELTRLPSESYSRTGGAGVATSFSLSCRSPRLTSNTWSWASTQIPPARPVTRLPGKGFGHVGSTSYLGTPTCACMGEKDPRTIAKPMQSAALHKRPAEFFIPASLKFSSKHLACHLPWPIRGRLRFLSSGSSFRRVQLFIRGQREELDKPRGLNQIAQNSSGFVIPAGSELRIPHRLPSLRQLFIDHLKA